MISTLRARVAGAFDNGLIVEVGGVGLSVIATPATLRVSEVGKEIFLYTALLVREDSLTLYGYQRGQERDLFLLLQTVSGIGPKVAHATLSTLSLEEISRAITSENGKVLEQVSGLGKKGAQRVILELKDKVVAISEESVERNNENGSSEISLSQALAGLGFTAREIDHALLIVKKSESILVEDKLRVALSALNGSASNRG